MFPDTSLGVLMSVRDFPVVLVNFFLHIQLFEFEEFFTLRISDEYFMKEVRQIFILRSSKNCDLTHKMAVTAVDALMRI